MNVRTIVTLVAVAILAPSIATAGELTKEECLDAHARGQDAREANKLSLARKLFLSCAQSNCPALVQGDCAKFVEDLGRQQPTVGFAARDSSGADLPDTTVYVDDVLVATRLDDGKPYDADPGPHTIKFVHNDSTRTTTVVLNSGEKGRTIVMIFPSANGPATSGGGGEPRRQVAPPVERGPTVHHPLGAKILIYSGVALIAGGVAFGIYKLTTVPDDCSLSDRTCFGTPGSRTYSDASTAVRGINVGIALTSVGAAALAGGLVWYVQGKTTERPPDVAAVPWISADSAGLAVTGRL